MRNSLILFKYNLNMMVKQKSFWFTNLFFVIIIGALVAFIAFSGDAEAEKVKVYNESSLPISNEVFKGLENYQFEILQSKPTNYNAKLKKEEWSAYIEISKENPPKVYFYTNEANHQLQATVTSIISEIQKQAYITKLSISDAEKQALLSPVQVEENVITKTKAVAEFNFDKYILFYVLIMLFYFLSISYPQSVLNMLVSAKESRAVESLLVRVTPTQFFYGKILTIVFVALFQLCIFLLFLFVPIILRDKHATFELVAKAIDKGLSIQLIALYILLFVITIAFYSVFNGIISAFVNRLEEVTSVAYYATIGTLAGFMVSFMFFMSGAEPSMIHYVLAIVPFTAPYLLFTMYMTDQLSVLFLISSLLVQFATLFFLFKISGSIYKKYLFKADANIKDLFSWKKLKIK